uniref:Diphthamide biosynthesis protein 3 n=1 Tax=Pongo abelii TaxID=9601 RepID=A0A8I5TP46_PONAB
MAVFHDEVEIEDFQYDEDSETYFYPCPCGDNFSITKEDLENGEDVATCPSCSLIIKVIYDKDVDNRKKKCYYCPLLPKVLFSTWNGILGSVCVWRNSPSPFSQQRIS